MDGSTTVTVVAVIVTLFILGTFAGERYAYEDLNRECELYGQHVTGDWRLTCEPLSRGEDE